MSKYIIRSMKFHQTGQRLLQRGGFSEHLWVQVLVTEVMRDAGRLRSCIPRVPRASAPRRLYAGVDKMREEPRDYSSFFTVKLCSKS